MISKFFAIAHSATDFNDTNLIITYTQFKIISLTVNIFKQKFKLYYFIIK